MNSPRKYKAPVCCVRCGKELLPLEPDGDYEMVDSGIVGQLSAPYGSNQDGTIFQTGVCDPCVEVLVTEGKMKPIGDYVFSGLDKELRDD